MDEKNLDELKLLSEKLKNDPNDDESYYRRGVIHFNRAFNMNQLDSEYAEEYELAISDLNKAVEINPNNDMYYYYRAMACYSYLGHEDSAFEDLDKTIELNPENAEAYFERAELNFGLGVYETAIEDYTKALEIDPNMTKAYESRSAAYQWSKDFGRENKISPSAKSF